MQAIKQLYNKVCDLGVSEDRVLSDSSLGLDDQAGVVKCWFVYERRLQAVKLLANEDGL